MSAAGIRRAAAIFVVSKSAERAAISSERNDAKSAPERLANPTARAILLLIVG
jgi:hypothetical protein